MPNKFMDMTGLAYYHQKIAQSIKNAADAATEATPFVVTFTGDDTNGYSSDKTFEEVVAAHNAGKQVYAVRGSFVYALSNCTAYLAYFSRFQGELIQCMKMSASNIVKEDITIEAIFPATGEEVAMPSGGNWYSVAHGLGLFVAIKYGTSIAAWGEDGQSWTEVALPSSKKWNSVAFGNGRFVAVAYDSADAAYSTDGKTWTAATLPADAYWSVVSYGGGVFVAVATNSTDAAYSTDGATWTAATLPSVKVWGSIAYANGTFVAVGGNSNAAAYSTDGGHTWTATTLPATMWWRAVAYGAGVFVAVGNGGTGAISTDGKTWESLTLPSGKHWYAMCYADGIFTVLEYGGTGAMHSYDGRNWTETTSPVNENWEEIAHGDGKFVVVASGTSSFMYSMDGKEWLAVKKYIKDMDGADVSDEVVEALRAKGIAMAESVERVDRKTAEDIGAAPASHNHALSDMTGTLPVSKGGTGATDAANARTNLGAAPAYTYGNTDLTAGSSPLETGKLYFVYE